MYMDLLDKLLQVSVATVGMRPLHVHVLCTCSLQAQLCDSMYVRTAYELELL